MIISSSKARRIVSNYAILQKIPELLAAVEAWKKADRVWEAKKDCPSCNQVSVFAESEQIALNEIRNLPKDAIARLKEFLGETELYIYEPVANGKPRTIQL